MTNGEWRMANDEWRMANKRMSREVQMLKYTGHPLVDVGVATITAFAGKQRPEQGGADESQ